MPSYALPPLHLYRHLLREASYLPPSCAPYIRQQITTRFHQHLPDRATSPLTSRRRRVAHSHLRFLRAANAGVLANMTRILQLATGHIGRRRRALLAQHFQVTRTNEPQNYPSTHNDGTSLPVSPSLPSPPPTASSSERAPDWLDYWDLPKLSALAASQSRQTFVSRRPEIKGNRLAPGPDDIPAENSFGRPLSAKAARGKLRKWYKTLLHRVMAPLPRAEWEALGRLARGEAAWQVPARRKKACGGGEEEARRWDWKAYAVEPVRSLERGQSRSWKARTGEEGEAPYGLGRAIGLTRYDRARMWRRLYLRVWEATPTMEEVVVAEDGGGKAGRQWKVEWGKHLKPIQVATPAQMAFFEGEPEGAMKKGRKKIRMRHMKE